MAYIDTRIYILSHMNLTRACSHCNGRNQLVSHLTISHVYRIMFPCIGYNVLLNQSIYSLDTLEGSQETLELLFDIAIYSFYTGFRQTLF